MNILETLRFIERERAVDIIDEDTVIVYPFAKLIGTDNLEIGKHIIIDDFVFIQCGKHTKIGDYVHIASHVSITGGGECIIGDFVGVGTGGRILTGSDDFHGIALSNPTVDLQYRNVKRSFVHIGKHATIGANVVILAGVTIGEGCSIGAGSVVTKDLPPWSICVGTPCHKIKDKDSTGVLAMEKAVRESE